MSAGRALYVSTYAPNLGTGRDMRNYACVRALALLGEVDVLYVPHDSGEPCAEYLEIANARFHKAVPSRGLRRAALYAAKRAQGAPPSWCRAVSPELVAAAERLATAPGRGRVIVADVNAATAMLPMSRRRPVIYNAHNIESDYVRDKGRGESAARERMRRFEQRIIGAASESWMVSRRDVEAAEALAPGSRVRYVPNVVDVTAIVPRTSAVPAAPEAGTLFMVGDFTYQPNRDARRLLADEVMPRVWRERPQARLLIAGREIGHWIPADPRVVSCGFVDDLTPLYEGADCAVVPLLEGAGSPLKFVEALAYGVPVVATPLAARGLEVVAGVHYEEGADAGALAAAILRVLAGGGGQLAAAGRALAEAEYSIESLAQRIAT